MRINGHNTFYFVYFYRVAWHFSQLHEKSAVCRMALSNAVFLNSRWHCKTIKKRDFDNSEHVANLNIKHHFT